MKRPWLLSDAKMAISSLHCGNEHWQRFCRAVHRPDWAEDPEYRTKRQRWEKKYILQEEIEKITTQYTVKEVGEMMDHERVATRRFSI